MNKITYMLLIIPFFGYSQNIIIGKIVGQTGVPIEYAEVILQTIDSIAVKAALTDRPVFCRE